MMLNSEFYSQKNKTEKLRWNKLFLGKQKLEGLTLIGTECSKGCFSDTRKMTQGKLGREKRMKSSGT